MSRSDEFYKRIASAYSEREGKALQAQPEQPTDTAGLERKLRARLRRKESVRWVGGLSAVAAAVLLVVTLGMLASTGVEVWPIPSPGLASAPPGASAAPSHTPGAPDGLMPLSFSLPAEFSVLTVALDNGKTVYTLENTAHDPVVMTLERTGDNSFSDELTQITLDGATAYASWGPDFQLLTLKKGGVVYTLTCRYELETLLTLGACIV